MDKYQPNQSLEQDLNHLLWKDVHEDNESFPTNKPLLAHYTSVATFDQIVSNDEIWLSNPLYMNDLEELRFGMNEGAVIFRSHKKLQGALRTKENHLNLVQKFDFLFNKFDREHAFDIYILCLSEHEKSDNDGVLSMWRGYGANAGGLAIVFDTNKFEENNESPFILGKVKYGSVSDRCQWIEEKIDDISECIDSYQLTDSDIFSIAHNFIERLKIFSLFTKHIGFHEEKEWRIVYMKERDYNKTLTGMLSYAVGQRGAEPKLKVKISSISGILQNDLSLETIVERVILGPTTATTLAAKSIQRMLEEQGKAQMADRLIPSTIPFRP